MELRTYVGIVLLFLSVYRASDTCFPTITIQLDSRCQSSAACPAGKCQIAGTILYTICEDLYPRSVVKTTNCTGDYTCIFITQYPSPQPGFDTHSLTQERFTDCVAPWVPVCYSFCNRFDNAFYLGAQMAVGAHGPFITSCRQMAELRGQCIIPLDVAALSACNTTSPIDLAPVLNCPNSAQKTFNAAAVQLLVLLLFIQALYSF